MWTLRSNSCVSAPQRKLLLAWELGEAAAGQTHTTNPVTGDFNMLHTLKQLLLNTLSL